MLLKLVNGACTINGDCAQLYACDNPQCNASLGQGYKARIRIIDIYGNVVKDETIDCTQTPYNIKADVQNDGLYFIRVDIIYAPSENTPPTVIKTEQIIVPMVKVNTVINPSSYKELQNAVDAWMTILDSITNLTWTERINPNKLINIPSSRLIGLLAIEKKDRTGCLVDQDGNVYCGHAAIATIRYKFNSIDDLKAFLFMKSSQMYPDYNEFYATFCGADIDLLKTVAFYLNMPLCVAGNPVLGIRVDTENLVIEQDVFIRLGDWRAFIGHLMKDIGFGCLAGGTIAAIGGPISFGAGCVVGAEVGLAVGLVFHWKDIFEATSESAKIIYERGMSNLNKDYNSFRADIDKYVQNASVKTKLINDLNKMYTHCRNTLTDLYETMKKQIEDAKIKYGAIGAVGGFILDRLLSR